MVKTSLMGEESVQGHYKSTVKMCQLQKHKSDRLTIVKLSGMQKYEKISENAVLIE
jgi:hypothetical protein